MVAVLFENTNDEVFEAFDSRASMLFSICLWSVTFCAINSLGYKSPGNLYMLCGGTIVLSRFTVTICVSLAVVANKGRFFKRGPRDL